MIRVLIVDDHTLFREGVTKLLNSVGDITVVGETGDPQEALALATSLNPDVVVIDITLGEEDGIDVAARIRQERIKVGIVIVTMHNESLYFDRAKREAQVEGYVVKTDAFECVIAAVRNAKVGKRYISQSLASEIVWSNEEPPMSGPLTKREMEILTEIAKGLRNREVAKKLGISIKTVESHRAHIMEKLGIRRSAEIVRYAVRTGLVKP
jgi:DNA-binding NarL/FixJ family response regulator